MDHSLVRHWTDVCILHLNVETLLLRQAVEFVVDEVSIVDVLLEADDGEALEGLGLVHHLVQAI